MRVLILIALGFATAAVQAANNATFVSQSVPTVMVPGQVYAVSVTMRNTGTTTWTAGTFHRLGTQNAQDNTLWTGLTRVALPASVAPNNNVTFSFNVTAPATAGTYNFQWKMVQDGVEWFGAQSANVAVKVGLNGSEFVSQSVPPVMQPGQSYAVTTTWKNAGGSTWTVAAGHKLGSQNPENNFTWGMHRVDVPGTTAPGANAVFNWSVTAPTTPGTYNFQWKMAQAGVEWFGPLSANATVKVGLDNAAFVSQSVPSSMVAGQTYEVSITMQNNGSTTWAAGTVGLGSQNAQGNITWGASKVNLASSVAPSAQTTFTFSVTAPPTAGTYNFQWKMVEGSNGWFGAQSTNVAVNVATGTLPTNVYFIHTDHLNTPRLVANSAGTAVWRWEQHEPFGQNVADEDPDANSVAFEFPLRFPGQYADKETNLYYNYFRNYDPSVGRYVESDPIGLEAGLNTYSYVMTNPLSYIDPYGLEIKVCFYYNAAAGFGHIGYAVNSEARTYGYYPTGNPLKSAGIVQQDPPTPDECKILPSTPDQDDCMLKCRARRAASPGFYTLNSNQCTSFVRSCLEECGLLKAGFPGSAPRRFYLQLPGRSQ